MLFSQILCIELVPRGFTLYSVLHCNKRFNLITRVGVIQIPLNLDRFIVFLAQEILFFGPSTFWIQDQCFYSICDPKVPSVWFFVALFGLNDFLSSFW